jgi:hypothetical protein
MMLGEGCRMLLLLLCFWDTLWIGLNLGLRVPMMATILSVGNSFNIVVLKRKEKCK